MEFNELEQTILTCPKVYEPVPFQIDWGSNRGQGKRRGKMVMGAMSDAPRGIKTYYDAYGSLPDVNDIRTDVRSLDAFQEFRYMKARDYGLNHTEAFLFSFSIDSLQRYWTKNEIRKVDYNSERV